MSPVLEHAEEALVMGSRISGASNTQKTIMVALAEGWRLRQVEMYGWCLFQPGRNRPFARVADSTIEKMVAAEWLTGAAVIGLGSRPTIELTELGWKYAEKLLRSDWARNDSWDPYDQRSRRHHQDTLEPESYDANAVEPTQLAA